MGIETFALAEGVFEIDHATFYGETREFEKERDDRLADILLSPDQSTKIDDFITGIKCSRDR